MLQLNRRSDVVFTCDFYDRKSIEMFFHHFLHFGRLLVELLEDLRIIFLEVLHVTVAKIDGYDLEVFGE